MRARLTRIARRLALPEAFGWSTFWLSVAVYVGTTILFDARRFGGPFELWILAWATGQVILVAWVLLLKKVFLDRLKRQASRVSGLLLIGTTAGLVRGIFLSWFSTSFGLADNPQLWFRLGGGAIAGLVISIAGAALTGASIEHERVISRLTKTRDALMQTRKSAPATLAQARKDIAALAGETLLPRLRELDEALSNSKKSSKKVSEMADQIREVISQEVRPTSSSLVQRVEKTLSVQPESPLSKRVRLGLPNQFSLASALEPRVTFGIALLLCLATFIPLTDRVTSALSLIGAVLLFLILTVMAKVLRRVKPVNPIIGTVALGLIGALSTVPLSALTQWSVPKFLNLTAMPIQSASIMAVLVVGIGYTRVVDTDRAEYEKELTEFNQELERELKWIDAQIWVIRRDWAYLLHGRVQSALTAALTRIGNAGNLDAKTIELVHHDVDRARMALFEGISRPFDLEASLADIAESWSGICALELDFEPNAVMTVKSDLGLARSINEILREAISNAVRHGNASKVEIKLFEADGLINLKATNDGSPVTKRTRKSLGTDMLDEVTLEWSLSNRDSTVVLEAKLAKATSS